MVGLTLSCTGSALTPNWSPKHPADSDKHSAEQGVGARDLRHVHLAHPNNDMCVQVQMSGGFKSKFA